MTVVLTNVIPWELIWPEEPSLLSRELVLKRRTLEFKQRHVLNHKIIQRLIVQLCMERKKSVTPIYIEMGPVRTDSLEKTLMLGKLEGKRRRWQRMRWLGSITDSVHEFEQASSETWWWTENPVMLHSMGSQRVGPNWVIELKMILDIEEKLRV